MMWYQAEKISERVSGILDVTGVRCFLLEGTDSALLVDTGTGAGNLKSFVDTLTDLPYQVVLTHGHVDHAGGAWAFDSVYLNPKDHALVKRHATLENRMGYIGAVAPPMAETVQRENALDTAPYTLLALEDGQVFPLGGLDVEVIEAAGHTQGMSCMLLRQERMLILGDACNSRVFLFDDEASSVSEYRKSLEKLLAQDGLYDTALFSHGPAVQPKAMAAGCTAVADEILAGTDDKIPFHFMGKNACLAKAVFTDGMTRMDGGIGNIVYNPTQILS